MRKQKFLFRWLLLASLVTQTACGEEGKLCRSEDMTKEFLRLAPGMDLQGPWRYKSSVSEESYNELELGQDNLPRKTSTGAPGEERVIQLRFGCESYWDYPLAVGQRNQHPIAGAFPPDMLGGGDAVGGDFIELLSIDWYDRMLCLAYLTGKDPRAPSQDISRKKTVCFEYRSSDDSIKMSWYYVEEPNARIPPGKPTSSTIYHRVKPPSAPQTGEQKQP